MLPYNTEVNAIAEYSRIAESPATSPSSHITLDVPRVELVPVSCENSAPRRRCGLAQCAQWIADYDVLPTERGNG